MKLMTKKYCKWYDELIYGEKDCRLIRINWLPRHKSIDVVPTDLSKSYIGVIIKRFSISDLLIYSIISGLTSTLINTIL